jgi:Conjugal transfer protein TraD
LLADFVLARMSRVAKLTLRLARMELALDRARLRIKRRVRAVDGLERKRDTRRKIELGGLVVKSGASDIPKAVLLGALLDLSKLDPASAQFSAFRKLGEAAFAARGPLSNPLGSKSDVDAGG